MTEDALKNKLVGNFLEYKNTTELDLEIYQ